MGNPKNYVAVNLPCIPREQNKWHTSKHLANNGVQRGMYLRINQLIFGCDRSQQKE